MEVVFTQDVPNKAKAGEVRRVPDGYARNYLLPQGLAEIATPEVLKRLHKITAVGDEVRVRETAVMESLSSGSGTLVLSDPGDNDSMRGAAGSQFSATSAGPDRRPDPLSSKMGIPYNQAGLFCEA